MHLYLEIQADPTAGPDPGSKPGPDPGPDPGPVWRGQLRRPGQTMPTPLGRLDLGPAARVPIGEGEGYRLDALVWTLIQRRPDDRSLPFDERGQLTIGRWLYDRVLAPALGDRPPEGEVVLHIHCPNEAIARLPWVLLARGGSFLTAQDWSPVLASGERPVRDCLLPAAPRTLLVAPEPVGVPPTGAAAHLDALCARLGRFEPRLARDGERLRVCDTWEALVEQVRTFRPQVLYYYGHGLAHDVDASTRLVFADGPGGTGGRRDDRPVADLATLLRESAGDGREPPLLAYINCCQGDAGGLLGVGHQLETEAGIPAVITNRTIAGIPAAQAQAMELLERLLLRGEPPHQAVGALYRGLTDLGLSLADVRWMTPVLHGHYGDWRSSAAAVATDLDVDWRLKIDRVTQFSLVDSQTRQMLREGRPQGRAFVWYGREGDGVQVFHERLEVELAQSLHDMDTAFVPIAPDWPEELGNSDLSFLDKTLEAFDVARLTEIPYSLHTRGRGHRRVLVYLRHRPVRSPNRVIDPEGLAAYLAWLDRCLLPLLDPRQHLLVGISFLVNKPGAFQEAVAGQAIGEEAPFKHLVFELLDALDVLARRDLRTFLRTHRIDLPGGLTDAVLNAALDEILARTGGCYEQTVAELADLPGLIRRAGASPPRVRKPYDY